MEKLHGRYVFSEGDRLYVRNLFGKDICTVVAVRQIKDGDSCFGCCFFMKCRIYPGSSPFARSCYSTIFMEEEEARGMKDRKKRLRK